MASCRKRLTYINCVAPKDHYPLTVAFMHSYEHIHMRLQRFEPNREACNAMLFRGNQKENSITRVEAALEPHMNVFK
eukprot:8901272-Pyramimonas_sp.AAC.1